MKPPSNRSGSISISSCCNGIDGSHHPRIGLAAAATTSRAFRVVAMPVWEIEVDRRVSVDPWADVRFVNEIEPFISRYWSSVSQGPLESNGIVSPARSKETPTSSKGRTIEVSTSYTQIRVMGFMSRFRTRSSRASARIFFSSSTGLKLANWSSLADVVGPDESLKYREPVLGVGFL